MYIKGGDTDVSNADNTSFSIIPKDNNFSILSFKSDKNYDLSSIICLEQSLSRYHSLLSPLAENTITKENQIEALGTQVILGPFGLVPIFPFGTQTFLPNFLLFSKVTRIGFVPNFSTTKTCKFEVGFEEAFIKKFFSIFYFF